METWEEEVRCCVVAAAITRKTTLSLLDLGRGREPPGWCPQGSAQSTPQPRWHAGAWLTNAHRFSSRQVICKLHQLGVLSQKFNHFFCSFSFSTYTSLFWGCILWETLILPEGFQSTQNQDKSHLSWNRSLKGFSCWCFIRDITLRCPIMFWHLRRKVKNAIRDDKWAHRSPQLLLLCSRV